MEISLHYTETNIGKQPPAHFAPNLLVGPIAFFRDGFRAGILQQLGVLGKTASGRVAPLAAAGAGPEEPEFIRRL